MSGYNKQDLVARGFLEPDDTFVPKSFTVKFLRDTVSWLIEQAPLSVTQE